jgi:PilZ domain-containing protein
MSEERNWKRIRERLPLHLPVRVQGRDTPTFEWTEVTRLANVTPFGAGFSLKHPTEKGRLLYMTIPMPRQLRVFDHVEDQYRIWAVVRYMKPAVVDNQTVFNVGVAFIGKRAPASYETEPWRRYDINATTFQALTQAEEILIPITEQRAQTRYNIAVDMRLELIDPNGEVTDSEHTVTENISAKGATIFTTLQIPEGRFVRLKSEQYRVTAHAAIRSRSTGADGVPRIHVEFIDREWPL